MKKPIDLNEIFEEACKNSEFCKNVECNTVESYALVLAYANKPEKSEDVRALVGISHDGPVFWNMSKQNVLAACDSGYGVYALGHNLPIMSIRENCSADEVGYYMFVGDGTAWDKNRDEHCIECCELFRYAQREEKHDRVVLELLSLIKDRQKMTDEQLKTQRHIELFFINLNMPAVHDFYVRNKSALDEIVATTFSDGKRIKVGLYLSGRPNLFYTSPTRELFGAYKKDFDAKLVGVCRSKLSSVLLTGSQMAYLDSYRYVSPTMPRLPAFFINDKDVTYLKLPNTWQINRD